MTRSCLATFAISPPNFVFVGINLDRLWRCPFAKAQNSSLFPMKMPLLSSGSVQFGQHSLTEEGWTRHQDNIAKRPLMERTGWSLTGQVAGMHSETSVVSDHPVCAASVAPRCFLTAQPLLLGEEGIIRLIQHFVSLFAATDCHCLPRPSFFIRAASVPGLIPSSSAAPPWPYTFHRVLFSAAKMLPRSASRSSSSVRT